MRLRMHVLAHADNLSSLRHGLGGFHWHPPAMVRGPTLTQTTFCSRLKRGTSCLRATVCERLVVPGLRGVVRETRMPGRRSSVRRSLAACKTRACAVAGGTRHGGLLVLQRDVPGVAAGLGCPPDRGQFPCAYLDATAGWFETNCCVIPAVPAIVAI